MIFYFFIFFVLSIISINSTRFGFITSFLILFILIAFKGEVGCDYLGYLNRYIYFVPDFNILELRGEISWYFIEYLTNSFNLNYQFYTFITAIISIIFFALAQRKIKNLVFIVLIFQIIFIQLGLSGFRQFIAVSIIIYAFSKLIFEQNSKTLHFIILIIFASTFHITSIILIGFLPFFKKLKFYEIILLSFFLIFFLIGDLFSNVYEEYDIRYLQGARTSSGAVLRFAITSIILYLSIKQNNPLNKVIISIFLTGCLIGLVNSIALHRYNFYFFPLACMILLKSIQMFPSISYNKGFAYILSLLYMLIWYSSSDYISCYIPYEFNFSL